MSPLERLRADPIGEFRRVVIDAASDVSIDDFLGRLPKLGSHILVRQMTVLLSDRGLMALGRAAVRDAARVTAIGPSKSALEIEMPSSSRHEGGVIVLREYPELGLHRLTTISRSDFWTTVRLMVHKTYPRIVPISFKQSDLRSSLDNLQEGLGHGIRLRVVEGSVREERDSPDTETARKAFDAGRRWTDQTLDEAFELARERRQSFTSIRFAVDRESAPDRWTRIATGKVYSRGEVHYDTMHADIAVHLWNRLDQASADKLRLVAGRGRKEQGIRAGAPLEISFESALFQNASEVRRFGDAMAKYPDSVRAVFHANPYYHASVADFTDGSSFDVWILSPDRILISPQLKATPQAIERLIAHIQTSFEEGVVSEFVTGQQR